MNETENTDVKRAEWFCEYGRYDDRELEDWEGDIDVAHVNRNEKLVLRDGGIEGQGSWITSDAFADLEQCE